MSRFSKPGVALFVLAACVSAQPVISSVSPGSASPGDEIVVRGTFPVGVTHIQFVATVGGFVGVSTVNMAVTSSSATVVRVTVPTMSGFAPPNATPPGSPVGTLRARDAGGLFSSNQMFYFHQGSSADPNGLTPALETVGLGTTNSLGFRAATSFNIINGAPNLPGGNPSFELTLENATPTSTVTLVTGQAAATPSVMIGDGLVGIDLSVPFTIWTAPPAPTVTDLNGKATFPIAIPAGPLGVSVTAGWAYVDSATLQLRVSNALTANL